MDKNRIEGAAQKAMGSAKDALGKLTGNDKLRAEGKLDKAVGTTKDALGKAKDAAKKAAH